MTPAEEFRTWVFAPGRTSDELFTVELLVEAAQRREQQKLGNYHSDYQFVHERAKRRRLNPAYRPGIAREQLDLVATLWDEIVEIDNMPICEEDRPVRDLAALRFFPQVKSLKLISEFPDLGSFAILPGLKKLDLRDTVLTDLDGLEQLAELEEISLNLGAPWLSLCALGKLPRLKHVTYHGNLMAWHEVAVLPAAERVCLHKGYYANTPLRDARELPEMPRVTWLTIDGLAGLRGIERSAAVNRLELHGPFADLEPLAAMPEVRWLKLGGELFFDLRPVAQMPRLRTLELWRYRGIDVAPLVESPRLRQVTAGPTEVIATELASLNAAVGFVDEAEFVAEAPGPPRPVRFIAYDSQREDYKTLPKPKRRKEPREELFDDDPVIGPAEQRWFERQLRRTLDALLTAGWGKVKAWQPGYANLLIRRFEDVMQLHAIVLGVHATIAGARFPWGVMLEAQPHGDLSEDLEEIKQRYGTDDNDEFDVEQQRAEWEEERQLWRERKEFLDREHRHRLRQQEGLPIEPGEFAPPPVPPEEAGDLETENEAEADEARGLGRDFELWLDIDREVVWVAADLAQRAAEYLGVKFEDWHALPEPPEARPLPR